MIRRLVSSTAIALISLTACSKPPVIADDIRPVRTLTVAPQSTSAVAELAGEVRPRVETRAGFQVGGRITRRLVEVGQTVRSGQPLAAIDAQDYRLAAQAADAGVNAAQVDRDQQRADYRRFQDLQAKGFISQADLDRRKASLDAAEARYLQAAANARSSSNQTSYSILRAPHDAVVTAIDAEVGQVVGAGQSVIRLARTGEKEVQVGIPEQLLIPLTTAPEITVRLWAGGPPIRGKLREVAPAADTATRTFPARITLVDPPAGVELGMTATVAFSAPLTQPIIALPLQSLVVESGATHAWLFDPATNTVKRTHIEISNVAGNEVVILSGVKSGDVVVTAGAHQLKEGQKVKLLTDATAIQPAGPITVKAATGKKG
jgi:RND family efflux transporter MFP subunit